MNQLIYSTGCHDHRPALKRAGWIAPQTLHRFLQHQMRTCQAQSRRFKACLIVLFPSHHPQLHLCECYWSVGPLFLPHVAPITSCLNSCGCLLFLLPRRPCHPANCKSNYVTLLLKTHSTGNKIPNLYSALEGLERLSPLLAFLSLFITQSDSFVPFLCLKAVEVSFISGAFRCCSFFLNTFTFSSSLRFQLERLHLRENLPDYMQCSLLLSHMVLLLSFLHKCMATRETLIKSHLFI